MFILYLYESHGFTFSKDYSMAKQIIIWNLSNNLK